MSVSLVQAVFYLTRLKNYGLSPLRNFVRVFSVVLPHRGNVCLKCVGRVGLSAHPLCKGRNNNLLIGGVAFLGYRVEQLSHRHSQPASPQVKP